MSISIKQITEHIGAEIDCDEHLRELSKRDFVDIKKAFDEYSVLVFRGQPLLDKDQINLLSIKSVLDTYLSPTINLNALFSIKGIDLLSKRQIQQLSHELMKEVLDKAYSKNIYKCLKQA